MSCEIGKTTLIPCEPFEARIYDIQNDRFVDARITGYHVAIREMRNPPDAMFTPLGGGRHGIIGAPAWEAIEDKVSASPE